MYKLYLKIDESIIDFVYDLVFTSIALIIIFLEFVGEKSGMSTYLEKDGNDEGFFKKLILSVTMILFILLFKFMRIGRDE